MVNQSSNVVIVETERGLTGVGEGGEPTSMDECASMLIGQDPFRIDQHWQRMMRGYHYPAGREKLHSLGALDLALWDLKAKALDVPVWQLLGGKSRDHVELYSTVFPRPPGGTLEDAARACREAGFRVYRHATDNPRQREVDRFKLVRQMYEDSVLMHKGAGDGGWAMDFHTELDPPDAINLATLIGHGSVRRQVMGADDRAPAADELAKMEALVEQGMKDGAVGLSTGLIYVPGTYAKTDEIVALARVVSRHGGLYATHMRNEGDKVADAIRIELFVTVGWVYGLT